MVLVGLERHIPDGSRWLHSAGGSRWVGWTPLGAGQVARGFWEIFRFRCDGISHDAAGRSLVQARPQCVPHTT